MKISVIIFFLSCIALSSFKCKSVIRDEIKKKITTNKNFMKSLSFSGEVSRKVYCEKCKLNKYQLLISINEIRPDSIPINNQSFQPYYSFNSTALLNISVVKELYDLAQKGTVINKHPNSDLLILNGQTFKFISIEKYQWLPI